MYRMNMFYTLIVLVLLNAPCFAKQYTVGSWIVFDTKNEISDQPRVLVAIHNSTGGEFSLDCDDRDPNGRIYLPGKRFSDDDIFRFLLRIDDGDVIKGAGGAISRDGLLGFRLTRTTYERLLKASKIVVSLKITDTGMDTQVFTAKKTLEAMRSILTACPVSTALDHKPVNFKPDDPIETPSEMKALVQKDKDKDEKERENQSPK